MRAGQEDYYRIRHSLICSPTIEAEPPLNETRYTPAAVGVGSPNPLGASLDLRARLT